MDANSSTTHHSTARATTLKATPSTLTQSTPSAKNHSKANVLHTLNINHTMSLRQQLLFECDAMANYLLNNGMDTNIDAIEQLDIIKTIVRTDDDEFPNLSALSSENVNTLAKIHHTLSRSVAPASPRALVLLRYERERRPLLYFLGPVPLVRYLSMTALFFLIALISTGLSPMVSYTGMQEGFLSAFGVNLLMNQLFLLTCAGVGASFANLFQAAKYVSQKTYDPQFDASYWSRIILGLISGLIMVELLPQSLWSDTLSNTEGTSAVSSVKDFGKPALAMLGGFSAGLVYRILARIVEAIESVFASPSDVRESERATNSARLAEASTQLKSDLASNLLELQSALDKSSSPEEQRELLKTHLQKLLGDGDIHPKTSGNTQQDLRH
ncbi:hypothetical protein [Marinibactrum halimedae]|uniref:Uncharacterized protein n=1 Tax=Marinibactrum halimedae TaxID=1444977 RepID=A0AA37WQH3_9GAMM|nr:hypothetical protein [Marinibactrum halimedae]MCD9459176.1 hypothetical protein [Marinibactrum halimedae]GLS27247.1 hypothetical protein GCM10007877_29660 [Marinibactrum halimedae]